MSEERDIPESEHDHLLDNGDDLEIFGEEYEDHHGIDEDEVCENQRKDGPPHGPATTERGGYYLCDDCAEDW